MSSQQHPPIVRLIKALSMVIVLFFIVLFGAGCTGNKDEKEYFTAELYPGAIYKDNALVFTFCMEPSKFPENKTALLPKNTAFYLVDLPVNSSYFKDHEGVIVDNVLESQLFTQYKEIGTNNAHWDVLSPEQKSGNLNCITYYSRPIFKNAYEWMNEGQCPFTSVDISVNYALVNEKIGEGETIIKTFSFPCEEFTLTKEELETLKEQAGTNAGNAAIAQPTQGNTEPEPQKPQPATETGSDSSNPPATQPAPGIDASPTENPTPAEPPQDNAQKYSKNICDWLSAKYKADQEENLDLFMSFYSDKIGQEELDKLRTNTQWYFDHYDYQFSNLRCLKVVADEDSLKAGTPLFYLNYSYDQQFAKSASPVHITTADSILYDSDKKTFQIASNKPLPLYKGSPKVALTPLVPEEGVLFDGCASDKLIKPEFHFDIRLGKAPPEPLWYAKEFTVEASPYYRIELWYKSPEKNKYTRLWQRSGDYELKDGFEVTHLDNIKGMEDVLKKDLDFAWRVVWVHPGYETPEVASDYNYFKYTIVPCSN